jgi:hypothetical protein
MMQRYKNREVEGNNGPRVEALSESALKVPLSRRQALGGLVIGLASLWTVALGTRSSGAKADESRPETGEEHEHTIPVLSESVMVAATKETLSLTAALGGSLLKKRPGARFRIKEGSFEWCIERLVAGEVAVAMLPRVLNPDESLRIARRYCQLVQVPVAATEDCFQRLHQPNLPDDKTGLYFLYVRMEATKGREALRDFIQLCQFDSLNALRRIRVG